MSKKKTIESTVDFYENMSENDAGKARRSLLRRVCPAKKAETLAHCVKTIAELFSNNTTASTFGTANTIFNVAAQSDIPDVREQVIRSAAGVLKIAANNKLKLEEQEVEKMVTTIGNLLKDNPNKKFVQNTEDFLKGPCTFYHVAAENMFLVPEW